MAFDKKQGFYWPSIPLLDFNVKIVFNWGRKHSSVTKLNVDHVHRLGLCNFFRQVLFSEDNYFCRLREVFKIRLCKILTL